MTRFHLLHSSLQFSDSPKQHTQDITDLFGLATAKKTAWLTGTEAGPGADNTSDELVRIGKDAGYRMYVPSTQKTGTGKATDCWIGVRKDLIDGGWETKFEQVIPGSQQFADEGHHPDRRWGPKGLVQVGFDNDEFGHFALGAAHYLTGARFPGPSSVHGGVDHWAQNRNLARYIARWGVENSMGSGLAFCGTDSNMADARNSQAQGDTFFGGPFLSAWDELKKWENTGHGPIDVIAKCVRDEARVKALMVNALNDKDFFQHGDHFVVEAAYDITPLKKPDPIPQPTQHACPLCGFSHKGLVA